MHPTLSHREFLVDASGWSLDDLNDADDRDTLWLWSEGRYEIVEGVLTTRAPQGFETVSPLRRLRQLVDRQLGPNGRPPTTSPFIQAPSTESKST